MSYDVRPIFTVYEPLLVIYPVSTWDKNHLFNVCRLLNIEYKEIVWGYGVLAYQFNTLQDYESVLEYVYSDERKGTWL
jgi:hypothetical protein